MSKRKKLTDAERLAAPCPHCGAVPGEMCHDRNVVRPGDVAKFCLERARPHITAAKHQRKADEINAKIGPAAQFPGLLAFTPEAEQFKAEFRPVTAADVEAKRLHDERMGVENAGHAEVTLRKGLNWITVWHMRRVAAELIGVEWEAKLWAKSQGTFGSNIDYIVDRYAKALCTTDRIDLEYVRHEDKCEPTKWNPTGIKLRLEVTAAWPPEGYTPVMTREQFHERFKLIHLFFWKPDSNQPDDPSGLFDRTIGAMARVCPC